MTPKSHDDKTGIRPVDAYGEQLVAAAGRHSQSRFARLRRFALPVLAVAALGGGGIAIAGSLGASDEPLVLGKGDAVTIGFEDPATGEPLRCPDGSLYTRTVDAAQPDAPAPRCSDGSIPPVYADLLERQRTFMEEIESGERRDEKTGLPFLTDLPQLPHLEVSADGE